VAKHRDAVRPASGEDFPCVVRDTLGHLRCVTCGGDCGGVILQELSTVEEAFGVQVDVTACQDLDARHFLDTHPHVLRCT
jgi:hypothetical protein